MDLKGKCAVVTGGGHGIGRALSEALAAEGARVAVADLRTDRASRVADRIGGMAVTCDVGNPASIRALVKSAQDAFGDVEVFCSNAGVLDKGDGLASTPDDLRWILDINALSHVWAAQAVVPRMMWRGEGWLLQTISSAALVSGPMDVGYTLSKYAALGFAEWLALNYGPQGLHVSCLCPSAVNTGMLGRNEDVEDAAWPPRTTSARPYVVEPEKCAEMAIRAMAEGRFLVLPHHHVLEAFRRKAEDYDEWLPTTAAEIERTRASGMLTTRRTDPS